MRVRRLFSRLELPLTLVALLVAPSALGDSSFTGVVVEPSAGPTSAPDTDTDSPGFIRRHTWEGSFDRAGDATRAAELELKNGLQITCDPKNFQTPGATPELVAQRLADCQRMQAEAQSFANDAEGIRKTQRVFAHVSRASDVAAVGAIGAVGYSELIKKKKGQADSLMSVANIQETAGYVSYASGAADVSMGAYALAMHKTKLEKMKKTLSEISANGVQLSSADSALVSKISNAAEKTKAAAVSHMAYGAGKVAVGYASMWLADKNRKQAENMLSLDTSGISGVPTVAAATTSPYVYSGKNDPVYYQNNAPEIILPDGTATSSAGSSDTPDSFSGAGAGASVMPSSQFRQPASSLGGKNSGLNAGGSAGKSGAGMSSPGGGSPSTDNAEEVAASLLHSGDLAMPSGGGGGAAYGGGASGDASKAGEETPPTPQILEADAKAGENSKGTGVNPNSVYHDAIQGLEGQPGSMAGVSGSGRTLFQVVKVKYNKMMEVGRLQGPGTVEVRN